MFDDDVIAELSKLKAQALEASAHNDRDFYAGYLADDAIAIMPIGMAGKEAVLASMVGDKAPFAALRIENETITPLGPDAGVVTYIAIYPAPGGGERRVAATTVYHRRNGKWQGILYQQTPLADRQG
jgi:hypothetical protein